MPDWIASIKPEVWAAVFSAIATAFAAIAAISGPISAAKLAEKLRSTNETLNEKRRLKLYVFTTLMQERAAYYSVEAVRAFNSIDIVFADNQAVRDAWAEFFAAMDSNAKVPQHAQLEKFRHLLSLMAKDLGLSSTLRPDDLNRVYYPQALAEQMHVQALSRMVALNDLNGRLSPTANASPSVITNAEDQRG